MCESGGNYGAVNPSSGAGGAYQILPSTWELYGGQGEPQDAPKAEQDSIAGADLGRLRRQRLGLRRLTAELAFRATKYAGDSAKDARGRCHLPRLA